MPATGAGIAIRPTRHRPGQPGSLYFTVSGNDVPCG